MLQQNKILGGRGSIPRLYHGGGLNLRVRPRVKFQVHQWQPDCEQNVYLYSRVTRSKALH